MGGGGSGRRERIGGDGFAVEPATPWLAAGAERVYAAIARACGGLRVVRDHPIVLAAQGFELWPDVTVLGADDRPRLVVELRRESTDRYALGIKRLAYAAAGVPRFWFVDRTARTLRTLALEPGGNRYEWPGRVYGETERVELDGVTLPVADLL